MKTALIPAAFLILMIPCICSVNLGISPEKLEFSGSQNEIICNNFSITGDAPVLFEGYVRWSKSESKNLLDYNLISSDLKINVTIPELINPGEYQLCISSKNSGAYYGALLYKMQDSSYGIGTWVELKIRGNSADSKISFISGRIVQKINQKQAGTILMPFLTAALLFFLILILKIKKKKFRMLQ